MLAAVLPARGADEAKSPGAGPAYELIGKVAVMHEGRVKPLDTVAREEVKQIYGRETIKLRDPNEEIEKLLDPESHARKAAAGSSVEKWGHLGAFVGWTANPEFWDDQPFILAEYPRSDGGSWRKRSLHGSRRSQTSRQPPTTKRRLCRRWPQTRSPPPPGSRPTCATRSCRSKIKKRLPRSSSS